MHSLALAENVDGIMTYTLTMREDTALETEPLSTGPLSLRPEEEYTAGTLQWSSPVQNIEGDPEASTAVARAKPTEALGRETAVCDFHSYAAIRTASL